jgi:hypothetical protein
MQWGLLRELRSVPGQQTHPLHRFDVRANANGRARGPDCNTEIGAAVTNSATASSGYAATKSTPPYNHSAATPRRGDYTRKTAIG